MRDLPYFLERLLTGHAILDEVSTASCYRRSQTNLYLLTYLARVFFKLCGSPPHCSSSTGLGFIPVIISFLKPKRTLHNSAQPCLCHRVCEHSDVTVSRAGRYTNASVRGSCPPPKLSIIQPRSRNPVQQKYESNVHRWRGQQSQCSVSIHFRILLP